jgi:hypothetical protein
MYKPGLGVALHVLSSQRRAPPSEIGMDAIIMAAVEKAGDELCSFRPLMHRNLAAGVSVLLPRARRSRRMASWLVRALLRGGRCKGLGWTAGVRYRRSRGGAAVAGNTAAGSADAAARPQNRIAGPDERLGGDPRQRRRFSREPSLLRRRMTRAPGRRADGSDPEPSCRLRGRVLPGPAAPGERSSSRSPRSRLSAPEAPGRRLRLPKQDPSGSGPWRLVISAPRLRSRSAQAVRRCTEIHRRRSPGR